MLDGLIEQVNDISRSSGEAFRETMWWCVGIPLWLIALATFGLLVAQLRRGRG